MARRLGIDMGTTAMNWLQKIAQNPWEMTHDAYWNAVGNVPNTQVVISASELASVGGTNREERYVRTNARYRELLERMKIHGFMGNQINPDPVILRRTIDGGLQIEDGNHRVAAAIDAGIKEMPVEIIEHPFHRDFVVQALADGRFVPDEVLNDYPDLSELK